MRNTVRISISVGLIAAVATATGASAEPSYAVVDTGQTVTYGDSGVIAAPDPGGEFYGQDAQYQGNTPSYVDNGDGTVTDVVTGLMWQADPGVKMTYAEAVAGLDSFTLAGYEDWRLPTVKELFSLIDFSGTDPSGCQSSSGCGAEPFIDTEFFEFSYGDTAAGERVIDSQWLSSTVYAGTTMGGRATVFGVNFADGRIKGYPISDPRGGDKTFFVIYVRGNPDYGITEFVDNGDGTISDVSTGLMWQQADSGEGMEWSQALAYCETSTTAGYDDWTLPDVKQLHSIVDYTRSPSATGSAAIDPVFRATAITDETGDRNWGFYWSSTTHASLRDGSAAAYVAFGEALGYMNGQWIDVHGAGAQRSDPKTGDPNDYPTGRGPQGDAIRIDNLARCVRSNTPEVPTCKGKPATVIGTANDDRLVGTSGDDVIWAGDGDDVVTGRSGDDAICLGGGDDVASGGGGNDTILGGSGSDTIDGDGGNDRIWGNKGDDTLIGGAKKDVLNGNGGDDDLTGGGGNDRLRGGNGVDSGNAGPGTDRCRTLEAAISCEA